MIKPQNEEEVGNNPEEAESEPYLTMLRVEMTLLRKLMWMRMPPVSQ